MLPITLPLLAFALAPQGPAPEATLRTAAEQLAAVGVTVDAGKVEVVRPGPDELTAALHAMQQAMLPSHWFEQLWYVLHTLGVAVEATPEAFADGYLRGMQRGQVAWYSPDRRALLLGNGVPPDADLTLLFAHELTHAAQHQRSGADGLFQSMGRTTDAWIVARCLTEGEAEAAAWAVGLHRTGEGLATLPAARFAVRAEEEADGAMLLHYALGRQFAIRAFQRGGWPAVLASYRQPPACAARLAQPDRDAWSLVAAFELPAWPAAAGPAEVVRDDAWGELGLRMLLRLCDREATAVRVASVGWRGDAMRLWRAANGERAMVWRLAFDRELDGQQFRELLGSTPPGRLTQRGTTVEWSCGSDAVLGDLAAALAALPLPAPASAAAQAATAAAEAAILAAQGRIAGDRWQVPQFSVSVPSPAGFEARQIRGIAVLMAPVAGDAQAQTFRDNVVATANDGAAATLAAELAATKKTLTSGSFALLVGEQRRLGGRDVLWFEYTSVQNGLDLRHVEVQWLVDRKKLAITATVLASRWEQQAEAMNAIVGGLQFEDRAPPPTAPGAGPPRIR